MTSPALPIARRRQFGAIALYIALAFGVAWTLWYAAWLVTQKRLSLDLIDVLVLGAFAPFFAAGVGAWRDGGFVHMLRFYARGLNPRMGWFVFALSFFLVPLIAMAGEQIHAWTTHTPFTFTMSWSEIPSTYLWLFVFGGALAEEFGWSYLSDKLDALLPLVPSTFVLGLIWAVWHLPLFFIIAPGLAASYSPFPIFVIATVSMRFLFAWTYHRSNYNILSNLLFHNASNMGYSIVSVAPTATDPSPARLWYYAGLSLLCAVILWIAAPPKPKAPPPAA